jgi:hypothetical protein
MVTSAGRSSDFACRSHHSAEVAADLIASDRAAVDPVGTNPTYVRDNVAAYDRVVSVVRAM